ncbi:TPA: hypothetical protein ACSTJY_003303 [Serratia fonticola]
MAKQKYILTHDSHQLKKGDVYEGDTLPAWLVGKAVLASASFPESEGMSNLQAALEAETAAKDAALKEIATLKLAAESMQAEHKAALEAEKKRADDAVAALSTQAKGK